MINRFVIPLLCIATLAAAAENSGTRLRLEPLLAEAVQTHPDILAARMRYQAARQRPSQESSLPDPMLSVGYTSSGSPRPFAGIGMEPTSNAGFMVSQEFPFPGKRKLMGEMASKEAAAEFEQYQQTQLKVISQIKQAYHRLHDTYARIAVMEKSRDLLRKFLLISEVQYTVGRAAQQDLFKAQTQLSILETRILRMEQEKRSFAAEINSLLSRPPDAPVAQPVDIGLRGFSLNLDALLASARDHAPMLLKDERMIQRSELAVNLARKEFYPDYTVSAGYFNMGNMPDMYEVRVDFKLPAYFWRKQRPGVAEKVSLLNEARRNYQSSAQSLMFRIKDDYLIAETSHRLARLYSTTVVPQASLTLESSIPAYEAGTVDFLTLLMNFMTMVEFEENYYQEMLSYHLALIRLEEMIGMHLIDEEAR